MLGLQMSYNMLGIVEQWLQSFQYRFIGTEEVKERDT
jgi:hypothetical protein